MPLRNVWAASTTLDGSGGGEASVVMRTGVQVQHTRVSVGPAPGASSVLKQPRALICVNGVEFEGTHSGASDQSATVYELAAGDVLVCRWAGGDPGAVARLWLRGVVLG